MRRFNILLVCSILIIAISATGFAVKKTAENNKNKYSLVLTAKSGSFSGNKLTLKADSHATYFSEPPKRVTGHITRQAFVALWANKANFKTTPPNAALSILTKNGAKEVVLELLTAKMQKNAVQFTVKILDGVIPKSFGASAIFIDDVESSDSIENFFR